MSINLTLPISGLNIKVEWKRADKEEFDNQKLQKEIKLNKKLDLVNEINIKDHLFMSQI